DMATFFPYGARCPQGGLKEGSQRDQTDRWASTLSADRMRPVRRLEYYQRDGRCVKVATAAVIVSQRSRPLSDSGSRGLIIRNRFDALLVSEALHIFWPLHVLFGRPHILVPNSLGKLVGIARSRFA